MICGRIINGLKRLKIDAQFAPINDIVINGKKISGNAQTRREGILLQHGTILYKTDVSKMFSYLNVSKEKISDKMIKSVEERVTSVYAERGVSFQELYDAIMFGMTEFRDYGIGVISSSEARRASELRKTYSSSDWNFSR